MKNTLVQIWKLSIFFFFQKLKNIVLYPHSFLRGEDTKGSGTFKFVFIL